MNSLNLGQLFTRLNLAIFSCVLFMSCGSSNEEIVSSEDYIIPTGIWRGELDLLTEDSLKLPFNFRLDSVKDHIEMSLINGTEELSGHILEIKNDTINIELAVFNGRVELVKTGKSLKGYFVNLAKGPDYKLPLYCEYGMEYRISPTYYGGKYDFSGKWETIFGTGDGAFPAIGSFSQIGDVITGTFLTETGDFRFLEGQVIDSTFVMTAFDGSHAFYFEGKLKGDSIHGVFNSGSHYSTTWKAVRNPDFHLSDPYKLTYLQEGYSTVDFVFPGLKKGKLSLKDKKYENKVVLIQIMGSWCPNCMDECAYFNELFSKYNSRGLEIIGVAFEATKDLDQARKDLSKLVDYYELPYDFAIGGYSSKSVASEEFPMLNKIMSFPTSILMDKNGKVIQIHTGFSGPSTGEVFDDYKTKMEKTIENLL